MTWLFMLISMTLTIYNEAGGNSHQQMQLVADTVINRVHSPEFPNTVTEVIYQRGQFDWTRKYRHRNLSDLAKAEQQMVKKYEPHGPHVKWNEAMGVAYHSLQNGYKPKNNYLYFRSHGKVNKFRVKYHGHEHHAKR